MATLRDALAPGKALNLPAVLDEAALLACLSVLTTNPTTVPAPDSTLRPPRCNFAGYCIMCGHQGCQAPACIAAFAQTAWAVCNGCNGYGADPASSIPCACFGGLTQVDPIENCYWCGRSGCQWCPANRCPDPRNPQCDCPSCLATEAEETPAVAR
ncbi:hypothetical protein [Micromonospora sp. WMMD1082]|uniref:hypothetical protein n=1 Tax=Micromonospora sp. WMMD1082 TaxID=3016104 RepID=UPI002417A817|nr:hypothetical protein [Micromonospora sp. WMMD1082]MDG4794414.1 hypothetical protein [Micromonospora sp. WMMD1082]